MIHKSSDLSLPEEEAVLAGANPDVAERFALGVLCYPVTIHVSRSTDYRLPSQPPPPSDDDNDPFDVPPSPPCLYDLPRHHDFSHHSRNCPDDRPSSGNGSVRFTTGQQRRRRPSPLSRSWQAILAAHPSVADVSLRAPVQSRPRSPAETTTRSRPLTMALWPRPPPVLMLTWWAPPRSR